MFVVVPLFSDTENSQCEQQPAGRRSIKSATLNFILNWIIKDLLAHFLFLPISLCLNTRATVAINNKVVKFYFIALVDQARPVKTDQEIIESSMAEDDPKCISEKEEDINSPHRWGRHHKGAKILATFYSTGKHKKSSFIAVVVCCMRINIAI